MPLTQFREQQPVADYNTLSIQIANLDGRITALDGRITATTIRMDRYEDDMRKHNASVSDKLDAIQETLATNAGRREGFSWAVKGCLAVVSGFVGILTYLHIWPVNH